MSLSRYFVYIVQCSDNSYYVGHSADVASRVDAHNSGNGAAWTAARRPVRLVYQEPVDSEAEAVRREAQLKGWTRAKKAALISGDLARLKSLSKRLSP